MSHPSTQGQVLTVKIVQDLFREALFHSGQTRIILFIDALDEGNQKEVRDMVRYVANLAATARSRGLAFDVCFASRHFPNITTPFCEELVLEQQEHHNEDIWNYVSNNLATDIKLRRVEFVPDIVSKSQAVFLWAVLVVRLLNEAFDRASTLSNLSKILGETPEDLDELLHGILQAGAWDENFLPALQWVLVARKNNHYFDIEVLYFGTLLGVGDLTDPVWHRDDVDIATMKRFIVQSTKGLVEMTWMGAGKTPKFDIQFIHESVRQHLLEGGMSRLDPRLGDDVVSSSHVRLSEWCQNYIRLVSPEHLGVSVDSPEGIVRVGALSGRRTERRYRACIALPLLDYVTSFTFYHIDNACDADIYDLESLREFPLLEWINIHNTIELRGSMFTTASILYLLLEGQCFVVAQRLLKQFKIRDHSADKKYSTDDCSVCSAIGPGLDILFGGIWITPLIAAAGQGSSETVKLLLDCGADINFSTEEGSPILQATIHGHVETVRLLLDSGAEIENLRGSYGSLIAAAALHNQLEIIQIFIEHGADVNDSGGDHETVLGAAAFAGATNVARLLLQHGANINESGIANCNIALREARRRQGGGSHMIAFLHENGALDKWRQVPPWNLE
jgi:hypothetical protein